MTQKKLTLSRSHFDNLLKHALASYPKECCAILLGHNNINSRIVTEIVLTNNDKEGSSKRWSYRIPALELLRGELLAESLSLAVVGYFHSHPDQPAIPSEFDLSNALAGYSYLIASVKEASQEDIQSYRLDANGIAFTQEDIIVEK